MNRTIRRRVQARRTPEENSYIRSRHPAVGPRKHTARRRRESSTWHSRGSALDGAHVISNREPLLTVEAIENLCCDRNNDGEHRNEQAPKRKPQQFRQNRHAQRERPRHPAEANCLLCKVPKRA